MKDRITQILALIFRCVIILPYWLGGYSTIGDPAFWELFVICFPQLDPVMAGDDVTGSA
jgi:hypothetical protein